ncbi:peptidase A24A domain protein [Isosphaera pallida ATCC 43644]|uniref:Peptidase A24A domain protein n=2 Tax=Isosphaera pallida TaxID=128 RepID=E8R287_ISOPI|nr:peptidase A24A domain protein [Isosphaera pallida ATCC 43644]
MILGSSTRRIHPCGVVPPLPSPWTPTPTMLNDPYSDLDPVTLWNIRAMTVLTWAWLAAMAAVLGSFLNVVVYRMPRGLQVLSGRSHCPGCNTEIRSRDNLPILGWFLLGGRCRACKGAISPRYPLVEAIVTVALFALGFRLLDSGGANLPLRQPNAYAGVVWVLWYAKWDLIALAIGQAWLMYQLIGLSLIDSDGFSPPWRFVAFGLALGLALPLIAPAYMVVPHGAEAWLGSGATGWKGTLVWSATGLLGGALIGLALSPWWPSRGTRPTLGHPIGLPMASMLTGLFLGWRTAWIVAALAAPLILLGAGLTRWRPILGWITPLCWYAGAAFLGMFEGRRLFGWFNAGQWVTTEGMWMPLAVWGGVLGVSIVARSLWTKAPRCVAGEPVGSPTAAVVWTAVAETEAVETSDVQEELEPTVVDEELSNPTSPSRFPGNAEDETIGDSSLSSEAGTSTSVSMTNERENREALRPPHPNQTGRASEAGCGGNVVVN